MLLSVRPDSCAISCGSALNELWSSNYDLILEKSSESRLSLAENSCLYTLLTNLDVSNFEEEANILSAWTREKC